MLDVCAMMAILLFQQEANEQTIITFAIGQ
jgi:hypothetical protein